MAFRPCLLPSPSFRTGLTSAAVLVLVTSLLAAQQPTAQDTTRPARDTLGQRVDSTVIDSILRDSVRNRIPTLGPPPGPLPSQRRIVFDKDAIRFSGAMTLGEILRLVPGVSLVRIGWFGLPELVTVAGQGAASVEIDWDGYPMENLGLDSAGFDTGRFAIGLLDRIEIEVLPTVLRVHLVTEMTAIRRARTEVAFATGDAQTNSYRVRYLNRWESGFGIGAGFTALGTAGPIYSHADINELGLWLRGGWMTRDDRTGIEYEYTRDALNRHSLTTTSGGTLAGVKANRSDSFLRAYTSTRPGGMGWRLDLLLGSSHFGDTSGTRDVAVSQASLVAGFRGERVGSELTVRLRDGSRPWEVSTRGSWSPLRPITLTALARRSWLVGGSALSEADAGASLHLLGPFAVHGDVRWRRLVDTAATPVDSLDHVQDWSGGLSFTQRLLDADFGVEHHGAFVAPVFGVVSGVVPVATSAPGSTFTVSYALRPTKYLTLHGWYRTPTTSTDVAFEPPDHALTIATLRSKFLPHFRRGVFDVEGQAEIESWGKGIAGTDGAGNPITVPGNSIWNFHVQVRLLGAILYWTLRNPRLRHYAIIPGYDMPRSMQRWGIMWEFTN